MTLRSTIALVLTLALFALWHVARATAGAAEEKEVAARHEIIADLRNRLEGDEE